MKRKKIIIITGPTAVGKTAVSLSLAKKINGEIICADSAQVYKHMDIGTAKITADKMQGIRHYMLDLVDFDSPYNVAKYKEDAKLYLEKIFTKDKYPIIVGGTGFYISALLKDTNFEDEIIDEDYLSYLDAYEEEYGRQALAKLLEKVDPKSFMTIHHNNSKRIKRALSYYKVHKEAISEHNKREKMKKSPYDFSYFVLTKDREELYRDINFRVELMLKDGLIEEVRKLKCMGLRADMTAGQAIGYKEVLKYLDGIISYENMVEAIKQNSRRYAKRQMTWFRREKEANFIDTGARKQEEILDDIINISFPLN